MTLCNRNRIKVDFWLGLVSMFSNSVRYRFSQVWLGFGFFLLVSISSDLVFPVRFPMNFLVFRF